MLRAVEAGDVHVSWSKIEVGKRDNQQKFSF